jgi:hypothetical protein
MKSCFVSVLLCLLSEPASVLVGERFVLQGELKETKAYMIMREMNKALVLVVAVLLVSLVACVDLVAAAPKPSVPEFTVHVTDHSYDVPTTTTTTTDPYDGRITTTTSPGYHMVNGSIELSIKNQPFTSYYNSDGYPIKLYYHIRVKGLDAVNWYYSPGVNPDSYFPTTNSTYTTGTYGYSGYSFEIRWGDLIAYRADGTLDFQVEALIGYMNVTNINPTDIVTRADDLLTEYVGQTSGWSNTQTITIGEAAQAHSPIETAPTTQNSPATSTAIPENSPASSPPLSQSPHVTPSPLSAQQTQPEPTQTQPVQDQSSFLPYVLVVVAAVLIAFVAGVLVSRRRYKKLSVH